MESVAENAIWIGNEFEKSEEKEDVCTNHTNTHTRTHAHTHGHTYALTRTDTNMYEHFFSKNVIYFFTY